MAYQLDVITLFPEMFTGFLEHGVIARAVQDGLVDFSSWNPRSYSKDKHRTVDDRPYGGGPGMVLMYEPLAAAIDEAKNKQPDTKVIYLSPTGRRLDQDGVRELSSRRGMILVAGRYEGIDQRLIDTRVDEQWSIGDYVLSGGETAAMVLIETVCRTLPGVLGHSDSAKDDSFVDGLLEYPHYTRPEQIDDDKVPDVLLSGNHEEIRRWRLKQALLRTIELRPDLLKSVTLDKEQQELLEEIKSKT